MPESLYVVGHSAVTCLGPDLDTTWRALTAGACGLARRAELPPERFLQDIAGLVPDLPDDPGLAATSGSRLGSRFLRLALAAAGQCLRAAGLDPLPDGWATRTAVVVGSAFGGVDLLDAEHQAASRRRGLAVSPFLVPGLIINQAAGQICERFGLHGPAHAPANACATGGHAIALGALLLRAGEADLALCGASESAFTPEIVNGFGTMRALLGRKPGDRSLEHPDQASRPFSADRAGFVMSEGAGMVLLATARAADALGLAPHAELLGWASNSDGHHMAAPDRDRIVECLRLALDRAGLRPDQVDAYNAHGTSTPLNDRVEWEALGFAFGDHARRLPASAIKGALGHSLGAASAIEAAVAVQTLVDQTLPPTINHLPDPELPVDCVPHAARQADVDTVVSASFGFGGTNNVLVLRRAGHHA
jgi:3-oxoacyl-[acyl-carrier-protein] synthase II